MVRRLLAVVLCGVGLTVVRPAAQQASPGQGPSPPVTFRGGVDSILVDATVTDKQGHPVTDLKAEDFEITENKKPQAVQTFKLVKIDDTPEAQPATVRDITSLDDQQREAAREDTRLIVIFLDDYHVRRSNGVLIREHVARFVSQLSPHDLVAVMYPLTPVTAMTFSRDHDAMAQTIMGFEGRKYDYTPKNAYEERYDQAPPEVLEQVRRQIVISALEGVANLLGTLRDGKKQVLFVSEGWVATLPQGVHTQGSVAQQPATLNTTQQFFAQADATREIQEHIFAAAARSNTSFYTLDPRGLANSEFDLGDKVSPDADRAALGESQDVLRVIADNTDGRAIVNSNDPLPEMRKMLSDTSAYYLLGYTSTEAARDGKFHEIQVRVKRKDVDVRARKGYWAYSAEDYAKATAPPKEGPPAAVSDALGTLPAALHAHAVRIWVGSQRGTSGKANVTFAWEASGDPALDAPARGEEAETVDHITLTATSIYGDVLYRGTVPREAQASSPSGRVVFDAPPGSVRFQIMAESAKDQMVDRDDESVDVPDFTGVGPLITTPVVYRGRTVRDLQQVRAAASPLPTVSREFSRTERLLVRFQAYGPAETTPTVGLRLLNSLGKSWADLPAPTRLPDGTFETEIGLGPLAPGEYLIEISAEAGSAKTQTLLAIRVTG